MGKDEQTFKAPSLQPLRIPAGWLVSYNNGLYEVDPVPGGVPEAERWWIFKEDMLQIEHKDQNRLLDLGWYKEGNLEQGHYLLQLYEGDFTGTLLHTFSTQDRPSLVAEIERILQAVTRGQL